MKGTEDTPTQIPSECRVRMEEAKLHLPAYTEIQPR